MSEIQRLKKNNRESQRKKNKIKTERGSPNDYLKYLPTLAVFLSLVSCVPGETIDFEIIPITGPGDIPLNGLPSDLAVSFDAGCTVIRVNGGADLLNSNPEIRGMFESVHVEPREGVQGPVWGEVDLHSRNPNGECDTKNGFSVPFEAEVDTKPIACQQTGSANGSANLKCDEDGQVLNDHEPVTEIVNGRASVPVDQNTRVRTLILRDSVGHETTIEVGLPTDCQQVQGQIRYNPENEQVEILLVCNGLGNITSGDHQAPAMNGQVWFPAPKVGEQTTGKVSFMGQDTQFTIDTPSQPGPSFSITNVRVKEGNYIFDATCSTPLGVCNITVDGKTVQVAGDGVIHEAGVDAEIGSGEVVPTVACDPVNNCSTGPNLTLQGYKPFKDDSIEVIANPDTGIATVVVNHPDPTNSIKGVTVSVGQKPAMKDVKWLKALKEMTGGNKPAQASCIETGHNANVTIYECRLSKKRSGDVVGKAEIIEVGGEIKTVQTSAVYKDFSPLVQLPLSTLPFGVIVGASLLFVRLFKLENAKANEKAAYRSLNELMSYLNSSSTQLLEKSDIDFYLKAAKICRFDTSLLKKLIQQKTSIVNSIIKSREDYKTYPINPRAVREFIEGYDATLDRIFTRQQNKYWLLNNERNSTLITLLNRVNRFMKQAVLNDEDEIKVDKNVIADDQLMFMIMQIYKLTDQSWLWKAVIEQNIADKRNKLDHITREKMEILILNYLSRDNVLEKEWENEWFIFFKNARNGHALLREEAREILKRTKLVETIEE